ncbi:hypothetical protein WJX77_003882 [Trebouxia sp. C0004]
MKRYMNMSDEELKELQFAILVELQKLGTSVPVLVGEALLATDKRHCAALSAILREGQYLAMASIFRTICKAAGHQVSSQIERIYDREADQYLEEWSNAEKVRARRNVSGSHPFSLRHGSDIPRRAVDLCSRTIKVKEFVEGVSLLASLSEKVQDLLDIEV